MINDDFSKFDVLVLIEKLKGDSLRIKWPVVAFIVALLTAASFWRASESQSLHWDDDRFLAVIQAEGAPAVSGLYTVWTQFIEGDYIPIPLSSFWLEVHAFNVDAQQIHVDNVIIHLINILVLLICLVRWNVGSITAIFVTVCFAVHPLQVEPVFWLSDRKSLLNGTGILLSFYCYGRLVKTQGRTRIAYILGYYFAFVFACLCKATTVLTPFAVAGLEFFVSHKRSFKDHAYQIVPMAIAFGFGMVRMIALAQHVGLESDFLLSAMRILISFGSSLTAIGHYIWSFLWPVNLAPFYPSYEYFEGSQIYAALGLATLVGWLAIARMRPNNSGLIVSLVAFLSFLLPVLPVFPRANFVNDRYMYLPIIGLSYLIAILLEEAVANLRLTLNFKLAALSILGTTLAFGSERQSRIWRDDQTFWQAAAAINPKSALALNNLAMTQRDQGHRSAAISSLKAALKLPPDRTSPRGALWMNLGDLYAEPKWADTYAPTMAMTHYSQGLAEADRPADRRQLLLRIGIIHTHLGDNETATATLNQLINEMERLPSPTKSDQELNSRAMEIRKLLQ